MFLQISRGLAAPSRKLLSSNHIHELQKRILGEVSTLSTDRSMYSSDASNYRVRPQGVVFPKHVDEIITTLEFARERQIPVTMRGAGTSVAGNAIGEGLIIDSSRYLNRILEVDSERKVAVVEPGVVMGVLQKKVASYGLRFGPDPSTFRRATIAGMIGNNACGPHALSYGKTSDNVVSFEAVTGSGLRFDSASGVGTIPGLQNLIDMNLATIRTELGKFSRQVSGYSLEHLLPENGKNLTKALVGSEGTLAAILNATVMLKPVSSVQELLIIGYRDMFEAADDSAILSKLGPLALEGMDSRLIDVVKSQNGENSVPVLPSGGGWLFIQIGAETEDEKEEIISKILTAAGSSDCLRVADPALVDRYWKIREDGVGFAGRTKAGNPAWPGWEDAAVPVESLGTYLRKFEELMIDHGVTGVPYGHFGDGCIHIRLDFPLRDNVEVLENFVTASAQLVASFGGSISGEHGDGRARSDLLKYIYTPSAIRLFENVKAVFDPDNLLNPGILVKPNNVLQDLRLPLAQNVQATSGFAFLDDGGDFTQAVHRCVGIGKCRIDIPGQSGFMCPSFQATKDEKDVTRGRARVLQELTTGQFGKDGWDSQELEDSLDLCLGCKACSAECPAEVDVARYKSEALHRKYDGKLRPRSHYFLGRLPDLAKVASKFPRIANVLLSIPFVSAIGKWVAGMDQRRDIPRFATKKFRKNSINNSSQNVPHRGKVILWVDSFDKFFTSEIAIDAVALLSRLGYQVEIPQREECCAVTWIATGQLTKAKQKLRSLVEGFYEYSSQGIPIVGLEPSCVSVLRGDLTDLLPKDLKASVVSDGIFTIAELLSQDNITEQFHGQLQGREVVVQPHCHHYAEMGFSPDREILKSLGANVVEISGCCGLAGSWGMEKGHYEVSELVAQNSLVPALNAASEDAIILADGFSCRLQAKRMSKKQPFHLVTVLNSILNQF